MAKKDTNRSRGPERTSAGEPVWVLEEAGQSIVVGLSDSHLYLTEDDRLGKRAVNAMKANASVADALDDAEIRVPIARIERVWFLPNRNSLNVDWATKKDGPSTHKLMCEPEVRDELFDELERALGDGFVTAERKVAAGEVIKYPLGCLGVAAVLATIAVLAVGGTGGFVAAGLLVGIAVVYLIAVLVMPETVVELVPAEG